MVVQQVPVGRMFSVGSEQRHQSPLCEPEKLIRRANLGGEMAPRRQLQLAAVASVELDTVGIPSWRFAPRLMQPSTRVRQRLQYSDGRHTTLLDRKAVPACSVF